MSLFLAEEGLLQNQKSHSHSVSCFRSSGVCPGVLCCKYKNRLDHEIKRGFKRCTWKYKMISQAECPLMNMWCYERGTRSRTFPNEVPFVNVTYHRTPWTERSHLMSESDRSQNDDFWHFLVHAHSLSSGEFARVSGLYGMPCTTNKHTAPTVVSLVICHDPKQQLKNKDELRERSWCLREVLK